MEVGGGVGVVVGGGGGGGRGVGQLVQTSFYRSTNHTLCSMTPKF